MIYNREFTLSAVKYNIVRVRPVMLFTVRIAAICNN